MCSKAEVSPRHPLLSRNPISFPPVLRMSMLVARWSSLPAVHFLSDVVLPIRPLVIAPVYARYVRCGIRFSMYISNLCVLNEFQGVMQ
mmetsp:Transcript_28377/g.86772  ORF Transcript_28377/g.86772 Transcript_28377/m.86772 type:complete len:88 (+) Transcript_28377:816-1079(+)|eukprot:scaffold165979_cov27-Tisochrysis_lutea.AAC.3